jgi:hypothetical protein
MKSESRGFKKESILKALPLVFFFSFILILGIVFADVFIDNDVGDFSSGTYDNTEYNSTGIMLKYFNDSERELPNNGITDEWGVDMSGNQLLLHFNRVAEDSSIYNNLGVANYDADTVSGKLGNALNLDGTNDFVSEIDEKLALLEAQTAIRKRKRFFGLLWSKKKILKEGSR